jgi:hypothetical protein
LTTVTFELVGGPHDGVRIQARPDIDAWHLYDPNSAMGALASFETFSRARVHRYKRQPGTNTLLYAGLL